MAPDVTEWLAVGSLAAAFLICAGAIIEYKVAFYGTDALLFNAYSARLLLEGIDPYTKSMEAAYAAFNAPLSLVTPTAQGSAVYVESYPALAFLVYVPLIALHLHNLLWVSVGAHLAVILLLAWIAPAGLRAFAPLVLFVAPTYFDYTVGGVTDILWVPFMIGVAWYWNRRPDLAAILLGAACAFKQTPWLVVPFALIWWAREARERGDVWSVLRPLALFTLAFALPNVPFAIWHPVAWFDGVTEPMRGGLIAFGSGLVQLTTSNYKDWQPEVYQRLSWGALAFAFVAYGWKPRLLAFLPFLAPAIVLFLSPRSLQNYFMYWPLIQVAYLLSPRVDTVSRTFFSRLPTRWIAGAAAAIVAITVIVGIARAERASLTLTLGEGRIDPNTQQLDRLHVHIRNDGAPKEVRFAVFLQGQGTYVRLWDRGLQTLVPHGSSDLWVSAASNSEQLPVDADVSLQVVAIDAGGGAQTYSNAQIYVPGMRQLANPGLTKWSDKPPYLPIGWSYDPRDFSSGALARERVGKGFGLVFDVPRAPDAKWRVASVSQRVSAGLQSFKIRLRPTSDYVGDVYPRAIFGIELIDALGRHVDYTIDSKLRQPKIYRRDTFTYVVVPGKLNEWNDIQIDLRSFSDRLLLAPASTISINVIGAVHSSSPDGVRGAFGGIYDLKGQERPLESGG